MKRICRCNGCFDPINPGYYMCRRHWRMVPPEIRRQVLAESNRGATTALLNVLRVACDAVADLEHTAQGRLAL